MEIIKETNRLVAAITGYDGICDGCGTPLTYPGELIIIVAYESDKCDLLVPVDRLSCPYCSKSIQVIRRWKTLEVSKELQEIKK
jgi:hypothetical protein